MKSLLKKWLEIPNKVTIDYKNVPYKEIKKAIGQIIREEVAEQFHKIFVESGDQMWTYQDGQIKYTIEKKIQNLVETQIASEQFLDNIVDRIRKKQLN